MNLTYNTRNNNKIFIRVVAILLSIILFTVSFYRQEGQIVYAKSVDEWQDELNSLADQADDLRNKMDSLDSQRDDQMAYSELLQRQIRAFEGSVSALDKSVREINKEIDSLEKQIKSRMDKFKSRLKSIYMTDKVSLIADILNNSSFSKYILHMDAMKRVVENDNKLIEELTAKKQEVLKKKEKVEQQKVTLNSQKIDLERKKKESDKIIFQLEQQTDKTKEEIEQLSREMANASVSIEKLIQEESGDGEFVGGRYGYPVPGYYRISSGYGNRVIQGVNDFHTGIDFPAPRGTPIVATNTGKIIAIKNSSGGYKGGYGKHIIIDHGGKQSTLYAHMSAFSDIEIGDIVVRGETIGYVGSTGWSTGNHTHLEIRFNGRHRDPLPYLTK